MKQKELEMESMSQVTGSEDSSSEGEEANEKVEHVQRKSWMQKTFIIYPNSRFKKLWGMVVILNCLTTAIIYPYCTAYGGVPYNWNDPIWILIFVGEFVMFTDIVINFLSAYHDNNEGHNYIIDFGKIANRYMKEGTFKKDFLTWLPLYEILKIIHPTLEILVIIKSTRFSQLFQFLDTKRIVPIIKSLFDYRLEKALKDPFLCDDIL